MLDDFCGAASLLFCDEGAAVFQAAMSQSQMPYKDWLPAVYVVADEVDCNAVTRPVPKLTTTRDAALDEGTTATVTLVAIG